jgi:hypothetical protein
VDGVEVEPSIGSVTHWVELERRKRWAVVIAVVSCGTMAALAMRTVTRSAGIRTASRLALELGVPCIWTVWFWILGRPEEMG